MQPKPLLLIRNSCPAIPAYNCRVKIRANALAGLLIIGELLLKFGVYSDIITSGVFSTNISPIIKTLRM
jgi:hypothetical protein